MRTDGLVDFSTARGHCARSLVLVRNCASAKFRGLFWIVPERIWTLVVITTEKRLTIAWRGVPVSLVTSPCTNWCLGAWMKYSGLSDRRVRLDCSLRV